MPDELLSVKINQFICLNFRVGVGNSIFIFIALIKQGTLNHDMATCYEAVLQIRNFSTPIFYSVPCGNSGDFFTGIAVVCRQLKNCKIISGWKKMYHRIFSKVSDQLNFVKPFHNFNFLMNEYPNLEAFRSAKSILQV